MTMPPPPNQPPAGPPPPPAQPPGGFGPPGSGGFGAPAPGGGWPPPPPPGGGNKGKTIAAIVAAAVIAVALITASVVFLTRGDSDNSASGDGKPSTSPSASSEEPSATPSGEPSEDGDATGFPTPGEDDDLPSNEPDDDSSEVPLPSFLLRVGDCYDRSEEREGAVLTRDCDKSHDAEVVSRKKLTGTYSTDSAVRRKADSLCRTSLRSKAAKQPPGTVGGTLISYPKARNAGKSLSYVTCSLTAGKGKKLSKPLV
ncbi:hypothetical protein ACIGW3_01975 [Streptomyces sp. NPDC053499]|uniref:hypothetical protein n=1 Tax=Streptomyces sp. NPDC053499 TaxID=3365707 RepID=UPI0037D298C6